MCYATQQKTNSNCTNILLGSKFKVKLEVLLSEVGKSE